MLLRPAVTLPVELYSPAREREFDAAEAELAAKGADALTVFEALLAHLRISSVQAHAPALKEIGRLQDYFAEHRSLPSFSHMARLLGLRSVSSAHAMAGRLKLAGFLQATPPASATSWWPSWTTSSR